MTPKRDDIGRFFRVYHNRSAAFEPVNAIFPRHVAPVVRQSGDGEREIVRMSWGFRRMEKGIAPSRDQRARRSDQDEPILARQLQGSAVACAGIIVLRANRRREASYLALVRDQGRRSAATVRLPSHLATLPRTVEEGRSKRRYRDVRVPDHDTEPAGGHNQSRAHAGAAHARG